ncbi:MAG: hypothetical protein ACOCRK_05375 [bacterium]
MSNVYCYKESCKNRSTRKSKSKNVKGDPMYRCTDIIITSKHSILYC